MHRNTANVDSEEHKGREGDLGIGMADLPKLIGGN